MNGFSPSDLERLVWLYQQGHSIVDVALQMRCSPGTVRNALKQQGVVMRPQYAGSRHPWRTGEGYLQERGELALRAQDL